MFSISIPLRVAICLASIFVSACKRKEVRVYTVTKELPKKLAADESPTGGATQSTLPGSPAHDNQHVAKAAAPWIPELIWSLPSGWKESGADKANIARFATEEGAQVAVTALASMSGEDTMLVNMYRQIRGKSPLPDEAAAKQLQDVLIAGEKGKLFEVEDAAADGGKAQRFIVAFIHRPEGSLFFKIQGEDNAVLNQRGAFLEFLKTIRLKKQSPVADDAVAAEEKPTGLPAGWKQVEAGPMQLAKFSVENTGGKADVMVSVFPSDTGGTLSNIKRWRGQIGMPEAADDEIMKTVKPLPGGNDGAVFVELANGERGLSGAIVPKEGKWFFFKMLGDAKIVSASKDTFIEFIKNAP